MKNSLTTYFKWILSFIFVAAGALKILSPDNTGDILIFLFEIEYNISLWIVYSIALLEIILGVFLYLDFKEKLTKILVLFSCCMFFAISLLGYFNSWEFACGCFGRFSFGRFDLAMVFRNSLLIAMALWITTDTSKFKNMIFRGSLINNNKQETR
jgi:membrane-bound metal-dependent hydrolase YbcI (DUF457 family)